MKGVRAPKNVEEATEDELLEEIEDELVEEGFSHLEEEYEEDITDLSPPDMSITKMSTLQGNNFTTMASVNFPSAFQAPI